MSSQNLRQKKLILCLDKIQSQHVHREIEEVYNNLGQDSQFQTKFEPHASRVSYRCGDCCTEMFSVVMFFFSISLNMQYCLFQLCCHATFSLDIPVFCVLWVYILIHFCQYISYCHPITVHIPSIFCLQFCISSRAKKIFVTHFIFLGCDLHPTLYSFSL